MLDLFLELHRKVKPGLEYGKAYIVSGVRLIYIGVTLVRGVFRAVFKVWGTSKLTSRTL